MFLEGEETERESQRAILTEILTPPSDFSSQTHSLACPSGLFMAFCLLIFPASSPFMSQLSLLTSASPNQSAVPLHPLCFCPCWFLYLKHHSSLFVPRKFILNNQLNFLGCASVFNLSLIPVHHSGSIFLAGQRGPLGWDLIVCQHQVPAVLRYHMP